MDPILILVIVFFAILVIIAALARRRSPEDKTPQDDPMTEIFDFAPDTEGAFPVVARRTRIVAPGQRVNGVMQKIQVIARPLPRLDNLVIPAGKGIDSLDILVINPVVRPADSDQELYDFDPPLTVTVWYNDQNAGQAKLGVSSPPPTALITGYQADDGWKFERLPTTVSVDPETGQGTLTAQIQTLAPKDPLWAGRP